MIIPCIDLQGRKVVQLVQGREKALEGGSPQEMLDRFAAFPVIQVIDLDAAIGTGSNEDIVEWIAKRARIRVGGGVRTADKVRRLVDLGVERVIVGTAAFGPQGPNLEFLDSLPHKDKILLALDSKDGRIVVKGGRESTS
jgi:phosphoribosylformimino-5-aminoimidazole carboxamide ribonucleotide (ProFAR) isomerase